MAHPGSATRERSRQDVRANQRHAQPVPYISPLLALREQALDMRVHHADERAVRRDARHDRVEGLADATAHGDRRPALRHVTFNLPSGNRLWTCSWPRSFAPRCRCRRQLIRERRLDEALRHEVRKAAIGRGRMRVILDGETEVSLFWVAGTFEHVLAGSHEFDDRQRQIAISLLPTPRITTPSCHCPGSFKPPGAQHSLTGWLPFAALGREEQASGELAHRPRAPVHL